MNGSIQCTMDYVTVPCSVAGRAMNLGIASQCPDNNCGPRPAVYQGQDTWALFNAHGDGYQGYMPTGATYIGNGDFRPTGSGPPSLRNHASRDTNFSLLNGATGEAQLGRAQNTGQVFPPIDLDKLKGLIQDKLSYVDDGRGKKPAVNTWHHS